MGSEPSSYCHTSLCRYLERKSFLRVREHRTLGNGCPNARKVEIVAIDDPRGFRDQLTTRQDAVAEKSADELPADSECAPRLVAIEPLPRFFRTEDRDATIVAKACHESSTPGAASASLQAKAVEQACDLGVGADLGQLPGVNYT
jgi:hypothetical protein